MCWFSLSNKETCLCSYSIDATSPSHDFSNSVFEVFVSQAVDNRVQQWGDHSIEDRNNLVDFWWQVGIGANIHGDCGSTVDSDNSQMGATCGKGLHSARGWRNSQYGGHNKNIGHKCKKKANAQHSSWQGKDDHLSDINIGTWGLHEGREVTEEMIDLVGPTKI